MLKNKKNKNKGVTLLEIVLALALLSIILIIIVKYLQEKSKRIKIQTAAAQMSDVIDDTTSYVKSNFNQLYQQALNASPRGVLALDIESDVYGIGQIGNRANRKLDDYYDAIIRIPNDLNVTPAPEEDLQVILYHVNEDKNLSYVDAQRLTREIKNNQGGVVYSSSSPTSPCSSSGFCIQNAYGVWLLEDNAISGDGPLATTDVTNKITPINDTVPGIAAISNISKDDATNDYLSREENLDNREENSMNADLNISKPGNTSSIFFNGVADNANNKFDGPNLTYRKRMLEDDTAAYDSTTNPILRAASLNFESNVSGDTALFKALGGVKSNLQVNDGDECDLTKNKHLIAVDIATGNLMKCFNADDYEYDDSQLNRAPGFFGEWRKLDWKKSFVLLTNSFFLASGEGNNFENVLYDLDDVLGADNDAKLLLIEVELDGVGSMRITTGGINYDVLNVSNPGVGQPIPSNARQVMIPLSELVSGNWMTVSVSGALSDTFWTSRIVGYIR